MAEEDSKGSQGSRKRAAALRDEIIAENINFMYGRSKENAAFDSDKRSFVKSNKFVDPFDTISGMCCVDEYLYVYVLDYV